MSENMFEVAVRSKFRFPFRGLISTEDLWDLSLENLDAVFKSLNSSMKEAQEESLLNTRSKADQELAVKLNIVRHVVTVKLAEKAARQDARERREKKQRIMEILAEKQDAALLGKSEEELLAMLDTL